MFGLFGKSIVKGVNGKEARELITNEKKLIILDIRTANEGAGGKIPKSKNIEIYSPNFQKENDKLDREGVYLVYCAAGLMEKMNFKKIYELKSGYGAY